MPQKNVNLPGVGTISLVKRRRAKNLRLSITPNGAIRVSLPVWLPYSAAINFARSRAGWINRHRQSFKPLILKHGHRIGKSYRMDFVSSTAVKQTQARLGINSITVTTQLDFWHSDVQTKAQKAAERALKKEAQLLLDDRVRQLAARYGFAYSSFKTKRLTSRWGSCSSKGDITLNYFLIQLPWRLIDYVIIHELAHTEYLDHSRDFWALMEKLMPDAKQRRREIKAYRPVLTPV